MINGFKSESFDYVKSKDLSFIEICRNYDPDAEAFIAAVDDINRNIERTGIQIASVGRWNALPNVGGKLDTDVYNRMVRTIDAAHRVGAPVFVCGCNQDTEISLFRNYSFAVEYFSRLLEETDKRNMKLAVYNCSWGNFVHSPAQWEIVLGELPQLMLKYDCSHAYYRNADYLTIHPLPKYLPH
jgi:sugar phosphate isomerase/epimerase